MIKRMIKEEWRMHSTLYRGTSFATFPVAVLFLSFGFSWLTLNFSTLGSEAVSTFLQTLSAFIGISVGSIGFSSKDAIKNVLGPVNLLLYSSRTLPVSKKRLLVDFVVKDIFYYSFLFLAPISAGFVIAGGFKVLEGILMTPVWFSAGLLASLVLARSSMKVPRTNLINYQRLEGLNPLTKKSLIDIARSSGGIFKIVFSLGILIGFYWFMVLYFPITSNLLSNPVLAFSSIVGLLNLSIYNWLNRFDELDDYSYLPVDRKDLLEDKINAFLYIALPTSAAIILASSYMLTGKNLLASLFTGLTTTVYVLLVAVKTTGLKPNKRLFNSFTFMKFLLLTSIVIVPLLTASLFYSLIQPVYYYLFCFLITVISWKILQR